MADELRPTTLEGRVAFMDAQQKQHSMRIYRMEQQMEQVVADVFRQQQYALCFAVCSLSVLSAAIRLTHRVTRRKSTRMSVLVGSASPIVPDCSLSCQAI
jgi:hypothetical protein